MAIRNSQSDDGSVLEDVRAYFARERDLGLEVVPDARMLDLRREHGHPHASRESKDTMSDNDRGASIPSPAAAITPARPRPVVQDLSDLLVESAVRETASLQELREVLGDCRRCKLCDGRTNIVFGVGDPQAELMFVGEGPGQDEDLQGEPFVGRAGALLTDIITKGMGIARRDVYIANVVKCRPPGNRNPEPDEIVACEPFLHRQIALIRPRVIVTLGTFATQCLLKNRTPISKQRGQWHDYRGVPVMPTFHPAYLLRNGGDKRLVWSDIKLVMERLALPIPSRTG